MEGQKEGRKGTWKERKCILHYIQHEISFQSFEEMSGPSVPIVIFNIVTSLIHPRDEVQLYDLVSDQPHVSGTPVSCILSMSKYYILTLQVQPG